MIDVLLGDEMEHVGTLCTTFPVKLNSLKALKALTDRLTIQGAQMLLAKRGIKIVEIMPVPLDSPHCAV